MAISSGRREVMDFRRTADQGLPEVAAAQALPEVIVVPSSPSRTEVTTRQMTVKMK